MSSQVTHAGVARATHRDFGDFPTPPALAAAVVAVLAERGERYSRVLEPTCGAGNFLRAALAGANPPSEVQGVEIQPDLAAAAQKVVGDAGRVLPADLFRVDLGRDLDWATSGRLLVVGNPPWVTVSALGKSGGTERNPGPERRNERGAAGLAARTGASNFDLAEAVILRVVRDLSDQRPTVAMLCKASVARAILASVPTRGLPIIRAEFRRIDAARWFDAAVAAGLLILEVGPGPRVHQVPVYSTLTAPEGSTTWGIHPDGSLVADQAAYQRARFADGASQLTWRQGVKHDAAAVLELTPDGSGGWTNGLGEAVDIEADRVYPLFKATDLARGQSPTPRQVVAIPQRTLAEDPRDLAQTSPRFWAYLQDHADRFARRRSSIYRGRPPFALFGIGPYTFSPYKVAVSGLHASPRFRVLGPVGGSVPLVNDTGYFLPLATADNACRLAATLNGPVVGDLLRAICFADGKRPITQKVLRRIDLTAVLAHTDPGWLRDRAESERTGLAIPGQDPAFPAAIGQDEELTGPLARIGV